MPARVFLFAASYPLLSFGNHGESPLIYLDNVHCLGTEEKLTECSHRGLGVHNCHEGYEEAGVICTGMHTIGQPRGRLMCCI